MKSFIKKSLVFVLMIFSVLVVFASFSAKVNAGEDSYTLVFAKNTGDGTSCSTSTTSASILSNGADYVTGNLAVATKAYYSGGSGLKLGASSNAGSIKINLSELGKVTATSVVVTAKLYNSSRATTLSVNGKTAQSLGADFAEYIYNLNESITYIQLDSTKYCWIEKIEVKFSTEGPTVNVNLESISVDNIELNPGKSTKANVSFTPTNATNKNVSFEIIEGSEYASVDENGTVTALKAGIATLKVTPSDTTALAKTVAVTVTDYAVPAINIGSDYSITAYDSKNSYSGELTGVASNIGTVAKFTTVPTKTTLFTAVQGLFVNTVAFKYGDNYLSLNVNDNKLNTSTTINAESSWLVTYDNTTKLYEVTNIVYNRKLQFNYNSGNPRFACYTGSQINVSFIEVSNDPSITISADKQNLKLGENTSLNYVISNLKTEDNKVWSSSNTSVATISNGTLTAQSVGKTIVKLTIGDVVSNELVVKVWPNKTIVTIEEAYDICDLGEGQNSAFDYTIAGTVSSTVSEYDSTYKNISVNIKDSNNDEIQCFRMKATGAIENGTKIIVTGKLVTYNYGLENAAYEIAAGCTYELEPEKYTVTFNSNGGSAVTTLENVLEGSKIVAPTAPTHATLKFAGWFKEEGLVNEWDFANDTVNANITLYAKWVNVSIAALQSALDELEGFFSLGYTYNYQTGTTEEYSVTLGTSNFSSKSYDANNGSHVQDALNYYTNAIMNGNSAIQFKKTDGYMYNTSALALKSIKFEGMNGTFAVYSSPSALNNENYTDGTLLTATNGVYTVNAGDKYFYIANKKSGASYLDSIIVNYEESTITYSNAEFRLKTGVDAAVTTLDADEYGVYVRTDGREPVLFNADLIDFDTENNLRYKVISLGDALNNPERLTLEFEICAYAKVGDQLILSSNVKTYSFASLIATYYANEAVKEQVEDLYNILVALGCYAE